MKIVSLSVSVPVASVQVRWNIWEIESRHVLNRYRHRHLSVAHHSIRIYYATNQQTDSSRRSYFRTHSGDRFYSVPQLHLVLSLLLSRWSFGIWPIWTTTSCPGGIRIVAFFSCFSLPFQVFDSAPNVSGSVWVSGFRILDYRDLVSSLTLYW